MSENKVKKWTVKIGESIMIIEAVTKREARELGIMWYLPDVTVELATEDEIEWYSAPRGWVGVGKKNS